MRSWQLKHGITFSVIRLTYKTSNPVSVNQLARKHVVDLLKLLKQYYFIKFKFILIMNRFAKNSRGKLFIQAKYFQLTLVIQLEPIRITFLSISF